MDGCKKLLIILAILAALLAALAVPIAAAQVTSQGSIADTLSGYSDLTTLTKAVNAAGLNGMLASKGPYTLFAPTNSAFGKFTPNTLSLLLQDKQRIGDIMAYHIVPGKLSVSDLAGVSSLRTVDGRTLPVAVKDGYLYVGGTRVINRGVDCTNGMIYPVESVIIPPTTAQGAVTPAQYTPQQAPPVAQPTAAAPKGAGGIMLLGLLILAAILLGGLLILWLAWRFIKRIFSLGRPKPEYRPPGRPGYTRPPAEGEIREPARFGTQGTPTVRDEGPYVSTQPPAGTYAAPAGGAITFDESAVNELKNMDASRLSGIRQYIIGSYNNFKDMLDFVRAARIDLLDIRDNNAVSRLMDRYRLSPFNSNTLELALEKNATIYTRDPVLMGIYRAAGAKVEDLRKLVSGA